MPAPAPPATSPRAPAVILGAYAIGLVVVFLGPGALPSTVIADLTSVLGGWGPTSALTNGRVEFLLNAVILMPVPPLGRFLWPRLTWRDWTACAFVVASAVEALQALVATERTATFSDIVANTLGGAAGGLLVHVLRWTDAARA